MATMSETLNSKVVSRAEWLAQRRELLAKEKEFSRLRDELSQRRRQLPWEAVEKKYVFEGPRGKESLADLFDGRKQLVVYHFMFGPGWKEGCPSCSFLADSFDGTQVHLAQRDTTFLVISRATLPEIEGFKKRMGWKFKWVSSFGSDFNFDYQVSLPEEERGKPKTYYNYDFTDFPSDERPGMSVFYKDASEKIYHTYSTYARGLDILLDTYNIIDMTPMGRHEEGLPYPMAWVRHHDRYESGSTASCCSGEPAVQSSTIAGPMLSEFKEEAEITRRILNRIPGDKLSWKPHTKSMSLGQLANHIAMVPGRLSKMAMGPGFDVTQGNFNPPEPANLNELMATFEESVRDAESCLKGLSDDNARGPCRLSAGDREIFTKPRASVIRSIMMNHWYHHRGQLSVYLRLLEVPVPVIYGRSADENPFA